MLTETFIIHHLHWPKHGSHWPGQRGLVNKPTRGQRKLAKVKECWEMIHLWQEISWVCSFLDGTQCTIVGFSATNLGIRSRLIQFYFYFFNGQELVSFKSQIGSRGTFRKELSSNTEVCLFLCEANYLQDSRISTFLPAQMRHGKQIQEFTKGDVDKHKHT